MERVLYIEGEGIDCRLDVRAGGKLEWGCIYTDGLKAPRNGEGR